jgi:hypothetical protein
MSKQYPGGFIIKNPTTPTTSSAPGMWTLNQAAYYTKQGIWPTPPVIDPYFEYVTTLLHGDGTNAAQNNTFIDSSTNAYSITRSGSTTQGTFTPFGSNWSNYFTGSSVIQIAQSSGAISNITQGDFTLETWIFPTATPGSRGGIACCRTNGGNNGWNFSYNSSNKVLFWYGSGSFPTITSATSAPLNTWTHIAVTRSGSTFTLYVNGVSDATLAGVSNGVTNTVNALLGSEENYANLYTGYTSNFRVVNGSVLYTSTFTPSTTPLTAVSGTVLLTAQSNRFLDNSSNAFPESIYTGTPSVQRFSPFNPASAYSTSVIGGSMYFNGSTDYLTVPLAAYNFGTGAFTCEAWVYIQSVAATNLIFYGSVSGGSLDELSVAVNTSQQLAWETNNTISTSGGSVPLNTWTHIAVVRNGSTITGYVNGSSVATTTDSGAITPTTHSLVGSYRGTILFTNGYISNARVTKAAVYTSNFTPATAPLPAIANTSLLLLGTNAGIYDNSMIPNWVTVGNAQISTSVKKYGTGSMYFDGTGDGLQGIGTPNTVFGTGDFTVEFWIYLNASTGSFKKFVELGTSGACFTIETQSTTNVLTITDLNTTVFVTSSSALSLTTWTHVAATRSGTTLRLFQNGTQVGSATNSTNFANSGNVYIGQSNSGQAINAYMDDLRITKGVARYTANFTPPTSAFPDQ